MMPNQIFVIIDQIMQDKVYYDLENESGSIAERQPVSFPTFMYDSLLMQYGLYQISIKILMQLSNGIKLVKDVQPFGFLLKQVLGLSEKSLRSDEVQTIIRCHTFFKLVQHKWIHRIHTNYKHLEINAENEQNMHGGGDCSIFDLSNELSKAFNHQPDMRDAILISLKPDLLLKKQENKELLILELVILKITNKVARIGANIKNIFSDCDIDKNN